MARPDKQVGWAMAGVNLRSAKDNELRRWLEDGSLRGAPR
jgi:hypothetical protein